MQTAAVQTHADPCHAPVASPLMPRCLCATPRYLSPQVPLQTVAIWQKKIVADCNAAGKPVIVATQMLESMQKNPRATRAEVAGHPQPQPQPEPSNPNPLTLT